MGLLPAYTSSFTSLGPSQLLKNPACWHLSCESEVGLFFSGGGGSFSLGGEEWEGFPPGNRARKRIVPLSAGVVARRAGLIRVTMPCWLFFTVEQKT